MQFSPEQIGTSIKKTTQAIRKKMVPCAESAAKIIKRAGENLTRAFSLAGLYIYKGVCRLRSKIGNHMRRHRLRKYTPAEKRAMVIAVFLVFAGAGLATGALLTTTTDLPSDHSGPSARSGGAEALRGQMEGAKNTPLTVTFQGLLLTSEDSLVSLREQAEDSLRNEYWKILDRGEGDSFRPASAGQRKLFRKVREERREELQKDPLLILVNKWHYLPEDYEVEPVDLDNGQRIGSTCYEKLVRMMADCTEAGGTPIVCSGYRPHWYQVDLFAAQIDRWLYAGYGQEEAEMYAATAVAIPGTSEHELGLAVDIYSSENMDLDESQIYTFTQQWLMENCWRYGFVLRYPKDKSDITGIIFEPWHYRYVGKKHAKKIYDAGICLEEYLDQTDHPEEDE